MRKYFAPEPRYSREELEQQAQEAIDAMVSLGRPPAEDWAPLEARLAELDQVMAARQLPTMREPEPMRLHEVRVPPAAAAAPPAEPATAERLPVAAQRSAN